MFIFRMSVDHTTLASPFENSTILVHYISDHYTSKGRGDVQFSLGLLVLPQIRMRNLDPDLYISLHLSFFGTRFTRKLHEGFTGNLLCGLGMMYRRNY